MRFQVLQSSVQASFESLPPWLTLTNDMRFGFVPSTSRQPLHWLFANVIMATHTIALMLNKTKLLNREEIVTDDIIKKIERSAETITYLTSLFLKDNPLFLNANPYINTKIYEAATAWLSLYKYRPRNQDFPLSFYDYRLSILITALENIGTYFELAGKQAEELRRMKMSCFAIKGGDAPAPFSILS